MRRSVSIRRKVWSIPISTLLLVALSTSLPSKVRAEVFLDFYGGVASTAGDDITVTRSDCSVFIFFPFAKSCSRVSASRNAGFDESASFGGRLGYWSESHGWLGGALDLSTFSADGDDVKISAIPLSFLVMFRAPLVKTPEFPKGRLHPYVALGPSLVVVDYTADLTPDLPEEVNETGFGFGGDLRGGLAWRLNPTVALFGELRYTAIQVDDEPRDTEEGSGLETTLQTTHVLAGLSFNF